MNDPGFSSATPDRYSCRVLEFDAVKDVLREFLSGPISHNAVAALAPGDDLDSISVALERVREARNFLREGARPSLGGLEDPATILDRLRVEGASCTAREILAVLAVMRKGQELRRNFAAGSFPYLSDLAGALPDFRSLLSILEGKIHPDGSIDSSASPELGRLRRAVERMRHEIQKTLESLMRRLSRDKALQEAVITLRNDRLVLPIRTEEKRHVPGVIHGASSSGATVFLEPMETVPLNNELVELEDREYAETQRILGEYTEKLRERLADLVTAASVLAELDMVFAKAAFARAYDCCIPQLGGEKGIVLTEIRHPLLEKSLRKSGRKSVPLGIRLREPKTMMVISGPNAGGKTVALKTVGIAVLMAQAGLPVAASDAQLPLFHRVLADIGDQQSIQANLSTFSAHITSIRHMVEVVGPRDLVLLDELGSSTEPGEGAALAIAILDRFRKSRALTFVTTHHGRLKAYGSETAEAENAAMEFDEETLEPTYRLLVGLPGKSSAVDIAARLGLPEDILARARELIGAEEADASALIEALHEQRALLESQMANLLAEEKQLLARAVELETKAEQERRAKLKELDVRLEETLKAMEKRWDNALADLRARVEKPRLPKGIERKTLALKQEAREEWNAEVLNVLSEPAPERQSMTEGPVAVGDQVRVPNLSTPGTVTEIVDDDHIQVQVGNLRLRIARDEVQIVARKSAPPEASAAPRGRLSMKVDAAPADVPEEINVIGNTAEEALDRVDEFLDRAYTAGRARLRVIHGFGKGILRKNLHEMFASHPHVEKFYPATQREGGGGATIVELRN
ncbi:MAG: endonuclease MutS2 [Acidobacteria bacterium]|nr:MAG: endonuclease MutS2 [Acidobacteriota bacterium]